MGWIVWYLQNINRCMQRYMRDSDSDPMKQKIDLRMDIEIDRAE